MYKEVSQKELLEDVIKLTRILMESTKNRQAQSTLEQALMYLGQVRSYTDSHGIPEYDSTLSMDISGKRIRIER